MSELFSLQQQITPDVTRLDAMNGHCETPGSVLGMYIRLEAGNLWPENGKKIGDDSYLVPIDVVGASLVKKLTPGSIVAFLPAGLDFTKLNDRNIGRFMAYETLVMVVEQTDSQTIFYGVAHNPVTQPWGNYTNARNTYDQRQAAIHKLQRDFNPAQKIEGTQMLTAAFALAKSMDASPRLASRGCFSHEQPILAVSDDMWPEFCLPKPNFLISQDMNLIMRTKVNVAGFVEPLAMHSDRIEGDTLLALGFFAQARNLVTANITGFGVGMSLEKTVETLVETTPKILEIAGNDGSILQAQNVLRNELKIV